ncbi:hypothetical protein CBL_09702 [Carabus blaptoides fortunei]
MTLLASRWPDLASLPPGSAITIIVKLMARKHSAPRRYGTRADASTSLIIRSLTPRATAHSAPLNKKPAGLADGGKPYTSAGAPSVKKTHSVTDMDRTLTDRRQPDSTGTLAMVLAALVLDGRSDGATGPRRYITCTIQKSTYWYYCMTNPPSPGYTNNAPSLVFITETLNIYVFI